jgi:hypothetical protein
MTLVLFPMMIKRVVRFTEVMSYNAQLNSAAVGRTGVTRMWISKIPFPPFMFVISNKYNLVRFCHFRIKRTYY